MYNFSVWITEFRKSEIFRVSTFKSGNICIEEIDEGILKIRELKEKIQNNQQMYIYFKTVDELILKIKNQLELIIPEIENYTEWQLITTQSD